MRVLVAMLVGLAQVAGPWLCCCVVPRAVAAAPAACDADACPCCQTKPAESPAKRSPALPCPCGGEVVPPAPPAKPELTVTFDRDPPPVCYPAAGPAIALPVSPAGLSDLPFLPPGTRLFVHHVLRC